MRFKVGDKVKFKYGKKRYTSQKCGVITSISHDAYLRFDGDKTGWSWNLYELDKEIPKDRIINAYFRDKNGNKEGQVKALVVDQKIVVRYHFCDTRYDKFVKNFPMNMFRGDFSVIPYRHRESFKEFLGRAKRYFQGTRCFDWEKTDLKEEYNEKNSPPFKVGDKVKRKIYDVENPYRPIGGVISKVYFADNYWFVDFDHTTFGGWLADNYELDTDETKEVPKLVVVSEDDNEVIFKLIIPKEYHNKKLVFRYDC